LKQKRVSKWTAIIAIDPPRRRVEKRHFDRDLHLSVRVLAVMDGKRQLWRQNEMKRRATSIGRICDDDRETIFDRRFDVSP
jgi:hypothetical protein